MKYLLKYLFKFILLIHNSNLFDFNLTVNTCTNCWYLTATGSCHLSFVFFIFSSLQIWFWYLCIGIFGLLVITKTHIVLYNFSNKFVAYFINIYSI